MQKETFQETEKHIIHRDLEIHTNHSVQDRPHQILVSKYKSCQSCLFSSAMSDHLEMLSTVNSLKLVHQSKA